MSRRRIGGSVGEELERQRLIVKNADAQIKALKEQIARDSQPDSIKGRTHRLCEQHGLIEQYAGRPLTRNENATLAKIAHVLFACGHGDIGRTELSGNRFIDNWNRANTFANWIAERGDVHFLESRGAAGK